MRKAIPRSIRFEVFKRDSFKCQYCGKSAPDVVLQIDHIKPVADGGSNSIVNLVTACEDCNSGKSDRPLGENAAVTKARSQLEKLQERREQLEMMLEWMEGLQDIKNDALNRLCERWHSLAPGYRANENDQRKLRQWMRRFGIQELFEAMEIAADTYLRRDTEGNITVESWEQAFSKIPGICAVSRENQEKPGLRDLYYIRGIVRNRYGYCDEEQAMQLLRQAHDLGGETTQLRAIAKSARSWSKWRDEMEQLIESLSVQ